jgi:CBS domain-containing protein
MNVRDILALKGAVVNVIGPADTIGDLCKLLREKRVGAAIVSGNGRTIEGVITERDVTYGLAVHGAQLHAMPVSQLMTKTVITCTPHDRVAIVGSTMLSRKIRHMPVEDNGVAVGMVSIRDVLNMRVVGLQQEAAGLRMSVQQPEHAAQDRE